MGALSRLLAALALLGAAAAWAQPERATELQVKAAFLYKFGGFVEWPPAAFARPDSPFTIGLLGGDAMAAELEKMVAGRTVQGRPIAVRRQRRDEPLTGLHVLFVGAAEAARLADIVAAAKGRPLLVVTDSEQALLHGSTINFVAEEGRVRFDVALRAAERGQLRISSRLLAVARKVLTGS